MGTENAEDAVQGCLYYVSYAHSGGFAGTSLTTSGPINTEAMIVEVQRLLQRTAGGPVVILNWVELNRSVLAQPAAGNGYVSYPDHGDFSEIGTWFDGPAEIVDYIHQGRVCTIGLDDAPGELAAYIRHRQRRNHL